MYTRGKERGDRNPLFLAAKHSAPVVPFRARCCRTLVQLRVKQDDAESLRTSLDPIGMRFLPLRAGVAIRAFRDARLLPSATLRSNARFCCSRAARAGGSSAAGLGGGGRTRGERAKGAGLAM